MDIENNDDLNRFTNNYTLISDSECFVGSSSMVKKIIHTKSKLEYAAKIIDVNKADIEKEIDILKRLKHPNIIEIVDVFYISKKNYNRVVLLFDWMSGGNVRNFL